MPLITWPQRCSRPLCSSQSTDRTTPSTHRVPRTRPKPSLRPSGATAPHEPTHLKGHPQQPGRSFPQDPTVCREANPSPTTTFHAPTREAVLARPVPRPTTRCQRSTQLSNHPGNLARRATVWTRSWLWTTTTPTHNKSRGHSSCQMLLRKEVIQPHLPVRLPCYDFVPIASPTFDGSLPKVGPPASGVTDFRDVTGGVYKARERIHRSIADLRLLATPTSRGRVADPDPN